ncbi:aromatic acid exporter family protein [uncultured Faecalibaculum sp.]|uniref:aromatic acid exporter family protein n=1 Tax=uncultured Faecalibaculum sp. TaxID=1729681 RepID=UPI00262A807F|nr:aromatic acid exporter family protein [uncultured Faecalibaculum sp.]
MKIKKALLLSLRIGLGSAAAVFLAEFLQLESPTAAGTITLLTLLTTRRQTIQLIVHRFLTFFGTIGLCVVILPLASSQLVSFAVVLFFIVAMCELCQVQNTLSVNALIATHLSITHGFNARMIINEFWLLCIGVFIAYVLNMFQDYRGMEKDLNDKVLHTETVFSHLLLEVVRYMEEMPEHTEIWSAMGEMEAELFGYVNDALHFQENRLPVRDCWHAHYFAMREQQLTVVHALHYQLRQIRSMPEQSVIIREFIQELATAVPGRTVPQEQTKMLEEIFRHMSRQPLPRIRQEFESRAILYHVLYDLKSYLKYKQDFVSALSDEQLREFAAVKVV